MFIFVFIGLLILGIGVGHLLRNKKINQIHLLITILIWTLLFLLGLEVGNNEAIMGGLYTIGWDALVITFFAVLGSSIAAWALWHILSKNKEKGEAE